LAFDTKLDMLLQQNLEILLKNVLETVSPKRRGTKQQLDPSDVLTLTE
jgi:hypothetical protein